jgi:sec-independent protein translocase protein TatA
MFGLGTGELVLILGISALMFGGKRLPELGRGLGQGMRGFRDALKGIDEPEDTAKQADKDAEDRQKKQ